MSLRKWQHQLTKLQAHSLAVGIFLIALALRFLLLPVEAGQAFLTFYPAIVLTFTVCGLEPGFLLAIFSAFVAHFIFFAPYFSFANKGDGNIAVVMFLLSAYLIARVVGQLRDTSVHLHDLIHNSPAGIITIDATTGKFTSANPAALSLFGYSESEMLSKCIADLTLPDKRETSRPRNQTLFNGHFEKRYVRKDGSRFWAETHASTLKEASGNVQISIGNIIDITALKQSHTAPSLSEQDYLSVLEDQTELICRFKPDGTMLYVNTAFCRFFALDQDAVVGTRWQPLVFPDDLSKVLQHLSSLNPRQPVVTIENRVFAAGEHVRWGQFINRAFFDDQDHLIEIQSVGRDVTERKEAEAKAHQLFDLLIKIANRVPGVVYQYKLRPDGSSCFPFASEGMTDIYGISPEQVREDAAPVFTRFHPNDLDGIVQSIRLSADTLSLWHYEYRVKYPDGRVRWLLGNAMPNREADGSTLWHGYISDITDRRAIEFELLKENEKNRAILRHASDGIHILNQSGCIVEVSDSFCTMLGYTREEMIGMHVSQWDAGFSSIDEQTAIIRQQFDTLHRSQFETRHRRKDGSIFDVEVSGKALVLDRESLLFNSSRDISERKHLAATVAQIAREMEDLYEYAPCGYHSVDQRGVFLRINATELAWLGCSKEEVIEKKKLSDFLTPASQLRYQAAFPAFVQNGVIEGLEFELVAPNQPPRFIRLDATAVIDDNGKFLMSRSVLYDITQTKKIQDALCVSEERFRMMANAAPVLIWIAGLDKACNWFNKVWLDFTGRSLEQEAGNGWTEGVHPNDLQRCLDIYISHFERRENFQMEYRLRRHDGEYRWIADHGVPLVDSEGNFSGYIGSCIDVTDSHWSISQLQDTLLELEDKTARLEAILEYASDGIHILDSAGNLLQFSTSFARMLGYTHEEVAQLNVADWDALVPIAQHTEAIKNLINTSATFETQHRRKDGSVFDVEIHACGVNLDGKPCLYASARDMTERKTYERQLKQLSIEQQAMLDTDLIGISKVQDGFITWKNKAIDYIFGYESDELLGANSRILYPDIQTYQALTDAAYPVLYGNGIYRTQMEMRRKEGEKIWIGLNGVLLSEFDNESMWMMADITLMKQYEAEILKIAYHDNLTGLPNRLLVADRLNQALAQAERSKRMIAVCYLDLDGFKPVNDNHGHQVGDQLLKEIANRMQAAVRANDTVGRLGGDEFVLLLTDLESAEEYQIILERVMNAINQPMLLNDSLQVKVGASIGITVFPEDNEAPDTLLRHADQAMYQAKRAGRNRVCFFSCDVP